MIIKMKKTVLILFGLFCLILLVESKNIINYLVEKRKVHTWNKRLKEFELKRDTFKIEEVKPQFLGEGRIQNII